MKCYENLNELLIYARKAFNVWEIKGFAEVITLKIIQSLFSSGQSEHALNLFQSYYATFKTSPQKLSAERMYKVIELRKAIGI